MNRFLLTLFLLFVALPLVVLVIVAPMSANNQFLFGISMIVAYNENKQNTNQKKTIY
jgi:cellulose synthase (UDP-forming)